MIFFTLTFLRHAESVGNAEGYYQGHQDYPLTKRGKDQVRRLISRWQMDGTQIDRVISSPLARAKQTAEMICEYFGCPLDLEEDWRERDMGALTGMKWDQAKTEMPKPSFYTPFENMGGTGEGNWELYLRAGKAIHNILQQPPARYLVVSHGGILNQAMHVIFSITPQAAGHGVHFRFMNTAFTKVYYEPDKHKWVVWGMNDFTHLAVKDFEIDDEES